MEVKEVWKRSFCINGDEAENKENLQEKFHHRWMKHGNDKVSRTHDLVIHTIASSFHSHQLYVSVGREILVLFAADGSLETVLRGHKDTIYAMDVSKDDKWLVTGGADQTLIFWSTNDYSEQIRFKHQESIQCTKFSVTGRLLICSSHEAALWRTDLKKLRWFKTSKRKHKLVCCAWNSRGTYFALGMYHGVVSIRNIEGEERCQSNRSIDIPIWTLSFVPDIESDEDRLVVSDWTGVLSFYSQDGSYYFGDKSLDSAVCTMSDFGKTKRLLLVGGCNHTAQLMSCEGVELVTLCKHLTWVWSVCYHESSEYAIVATANGVLAAYQVNCRLISDISLDRMAIVKNMTDIHLYDLFEGREAILKCRNLIERITLWKNTLAVQLTHRIVLYSENSNYEGWLQYHLRTKILTAERLQLLQVTKSLLWLTDATMLLARDFFGEDQCKWQFEYNTSVTCVVEQTNNDDSILIALVNGDVYKVVAFETQPVYLFKHDGIPMMLRVSPRSLQVAVIDDARILSIYSMTTTSKQLLFQNPNTFGVLWNTNVRDVFAYFIGTRVFIQQLADKLCELSVHGIPCSFQQNRIYCLDKFEMTHYEIAHDVLVKDAH
jgi:intraflagellar transport protein 122